MSELTRRELIRLGGAGALALGAAGLGLDRARAAWAAGPGLEQPAAGGAPVRLLLNGAPAGPGVFAFPSEVDTVVLDNGLIRFTFGRDDAAGGVVTGWTDTSITATSVVVDGTELAHNLNGIAPRDPDRQHSFYIDAGGGRSRLVCSQVAVLRAGDDLVEVAFVDTTTTPLRQEHHLIMRRGRRGLYGYDILSNVGDVQTSINEVRMNARWDRSILDHAFNWERGGGQQPTYAYLLTQQQVQDETWLIDGVNNPDLPSPDSNSGNLPPGTVYTKYNWSLYHHENPMFGHYGNGFGVWFTALGGVTDQTLGAFYGVGPNHQDLAIHQDALILNYFGANHYGLPSYPLQPGYRRLYGPWLTYVTTGRRDDPEGVIADAAAVARAEIEANRQGAGFVDDPLYPPPDERTAVHGRIQVADGRPAGNLWVVLSTQSVTDVYTIHEPTYFVRTDADGRFTLPGVPPAWLPGTTTPGTYTLYAFGGRGSITDQLVVPGITVRDRDQDLGTIAWSPTNRTTFLWQIGRSDRSGGEFALAANPADRSNPRAYEKPSRVHGDLTFEVGSGWEPEDWYYAQTNAGTWAVRFTVDRPHTGTVFLTVSSSMQQGSRPTIALNGVPATGALPGNNDSTIARQADRSGFPRLAVLTFPAAALQVGVNALTLTRGPGGAAGSGLGWDTLVLEVDEPAASPAASFVGEVVSISRGPSAQVWTIRIANVGAGPANDVRLDGFVLRPPIGQGRSPRIAGRDPNRFPVPVAATLPPGGAVTTEVTLLDQPPGLGFEATIPFSANGGRTAGVISARG
ncbi:MAG TPA: polysaccharide lyase family protein [Candidatus Dormibacteraeota bacterium]|nr:polysaccharide lyase family protein [Candidatus Dormibacteraeota bacterium]